jgi:hypothetical protein
MKAYEYILAKQIHWALNQGISLVGSRGKRGRGAYTHILEENLFEPLDPDVRKHFETGDGGEINGSRNKPAKMQAVHSSSAFLRYSSVYSRSAPERFNAFLTRPMIENAFPSSPTNFTGGFVDGPFISYASS